jgi:hypothetical protein
MKVRELFEQLKHDLDAHGDLEFVVELKDSAGNIIRCDHLYDRYVSMGAPADQRYVLRMGSGAAYAYQQLITPWGPAGEYAADGRGTE